ncbi:RNI-like protein [Microdochium trichocladiopsis]|uniref:RNI-like protein n=1 Tax=Microdochium trichocladiopsis TaxID=1682393 RepID=A0A9P8Y939_9PEZI|nr:RNI-like protein [Microdochium trichocladiopsis]KAH7033439.1 RNI-like protein [Microdochium trichocladiopsis]
MSSSRQTRTGRSIRGPQSALTDFLASQNISAAQIRADADARRAAAAREAGPSTTTVAEEPAEEEDEDEEEDVPTTSRRAAAARARDQKRKKQAETIEKIKKSKAYKKRKREADDSDSDDLVETMFAEKLTPLPGQMEHCEICEKRFTVTPYSRAGPNGGLLCAKCSKDLAKDDDAAKKKKKKPLNTGGGGRRKTQSKILDGTQPTGAKTLTTLCVETLAKNIELADDLGDLPPRAIDRIARLLSKRRMLGPQTLNLFLQPATEQVMVYDGARLSSDDYKRIFSVASRLEKLKLRNAIQFKDEVMEYLLGRQLMLKYFYIHGANLLSAAVWERYIREKGAHLETLQIYYTDKHVNDEILKSVKNHCHALKRLKICHNQQVSDEGLLHIAEMSSLEHLGLQLVKFTTTEPYVKIVQNVGRNLRTFSIKEVPDVDDRLLDALHKEATVLTKLRITGSEVMTDSGFARLFTDWKNRPLVSVDLQRCRHVDAAKPRENAHLVGFCSDGFRALMKHSGRQLRYLNVHACRHISQEAFEDAFAEDKTYPELQYVEVSFCEEVTDFIVGSIFRACPNLKEMNVFGCMKVKDVRVPRGRILVGVPNAQGMVIEGSDD